MMGNLGSHLLNTTNQAVFDCDICTYFTHLTLQYYAKNLSIVKIWIEWNFDSSGIFLRLTQHSKYRHCLHHLHQCLSKGWSSLYTLIYYTHFLFATLSVIFISVKQNNHKRFYTYSIHEIHFSFCNLVRICINAC